MAFYTVVAGWIIQYFVRFLAGQTEQLSFTGMISAPAENVVYLLITVLLAFTVLSFGLQGGLERVTKIMMVALLLLMLVIIGHSLTLPGAGDGLAFYLVPDFAKVNREMIVKAMDQAFFTLSLGMGGMAIFGSYIGKERSLLGEAKTVIGLDTLVVNKINI
jgi:NSS family neurotransmitter:Na+ symporter